MFAKNKLAQKN